MVGKYSNIRISYWIYCTQTLVQGVPRYLAPFKFVNFVQYNIKWPATHGDIFWGRPQKISPSFSWPYNTNIFKNVNVLFHHPNDPTHYDVHGTRNKLINPIDKQHKGFSLPFLRKKLLRKVVWTLLFFHSYFCSGVILVSMIFLVTVTGISQTVWALAR